MSEIETSGTLPFTGIDITMEHDRIFPVDVSNQGRIVCIIQPIDWFSLLSDSEIDFESAWRLYNDFFSDSKETLL